MAEITKTKSSPATIENFLLFSGDWTSLGTRTYTDSSTCRAVFHRPKPKDLSPTPMFVNRTKWNTSSYSSRTRRGALEWVHAGKPVRTREIRSSESGTSARIAQTDALARLSRGSLNAAQALAESRESFGTILTNLYRLGAFAKALKKGDFKGAADVLDIQLSRRGRARLRKQSPLERMSNGWLEYWYGIAPIISDVEGAIELADTSFHEGASRTAHGGISRTQMAEVADLTKVNEWDSTDTIEIPPRVSFRGEISNPNLRRAQELGLLNPASLWWELVPLSFVFDWFGTIGAWLDSLTHGAGLRFTYGCRITYRASVRYIEGIAYYRKSESITRMPVAPSIGYNPFLLRSSPLRGNQITTLAALFRQRL